ncbi:glucosamine kinase [Pararobbsia alpina]|uniref:BadF/BadG/BcrA/BcrD ATPase family protein n=1 Tax=Pararobbsia alpina TaxID=621374 RepID=UPI0039A71F13
MARFAVGVDGGGSGTRVLIADEHGSVIARANAGPSALGLGVDRAWEEIGRATRTALESVGVALDWSACALCCGLSGVNNATWRAAFERSIPAGASLLLVSDAYTTLWGAHGGQPGVIVALGTGSIAAALVSVPNAAAGSEVGGDARLEERISGGYGFPSGDEASGAWLGLRALVYLQQVMDGRRPADAFSDALREQLGVTTRDELVEWSCDANQTAYATLAPTVIAFGGESNPFAHGLLNQAGEEIARMIDALDPEGVMPVALCGGLAEPLAPFVPARFAPRLCAPMTDSAGGALALALRRIATGA